MTHQPLMPDGSGAPEALTPKQVIDFLQLEPVNANATLRTLRKHGLRVAKVGGVVRVSLVEVLRFFEEQHKGTDQTPAASNKPPRKVKQ